MKLFVAMITLALAASGVAQAAGKGDAQVGKDVFAARCKTCHGPQGAGNPAIAKVLKVTLPVLGSKQIQAKSDDEFKKTVTEGQGKMKPVQGLSAKEVQDVIAFVRTLAN